VLTLACGIPGADTVATVRGAKVGDARIVSVDIVLLVTASGSIVILGEPIGMAEFREDRML
jgi:hypothetical protein